MERTRTAAQQPSLNFANKSGRPNGAAPPRTAPVLKSHDFPICKDADWFYLDVPMRDTRFVKALRCMCKKLVEWARRSQWLQQIAGLTTTERELGFQWLVVTKANRDAVEAVEQATVVRRGMVTLSGLPGTGKSTEYAAHLCGECFA